jgi:hypothetical protein
MIESISTLHCSACSLREPCHMRVHRSPWMRQQIGSFRRACRNTRMMLGVYVVLVAMLLLLLLRQLV